MSQETFAGIDVSKSVLDVVARKQGGELATARFANDAAGHRKLVAWLTQRGRSARVVLEPTGAYSLEVALALHGAARIAVMMANPRAVKQFAGALRQRSKTDVLAAVALQEYAARMPFVLWEPPPAAVLELRAVARRIAALVVERTREQNRFEAATANRAGCTIVRKDLRMNIQHLQRRIARLTSQALGLVAADATLQRAYDQLQSICGIATHSAVQLLPELLALPAGMTARQWVAHAGLDPRACESGTSVAKRPRLSKLGNVHIRRILFMPALVAVRQNPHVRAFFDKLIARQKKPLQAYVAVMRKLLHAIYGMFHSGTDFCAEKFHAAACGGA